VLRRIAVAGGFGLLAWAFTVVLSVFRVLLNPGLWDRVTFAAVAWTLAYGAFFALAAAACERLAALPLRLFRYVLVGAVLGALLWSYMTTTWTFTARATAVIEPTGGVLQAAAIGAGLGALGGLMILGLALLRED
jgi:hypothetical protein